MATRLLEICIISILSLCLTFVVLEKVSFEVDDRREHHKLWIKPVVQLVQKLKSDTRIWSGPWNYDAKGRQLPPGSQCWYCNVYFGPSTPQFPGQDEDAAKVECTLSKFRHCPDCPSTEAKECKKQSDNSYKCTCSQCTIKNVRGCPPCSQQLGGRPELPACETQNDGTSECRCVMTCSSDKACEAENALCRINKGIAKCQATGGGGNGCVCTKKCNKIADCEMLQKINDNCNLGIHDLTCKDGGLGGLFPLTGTCMCTPKKCKSNAFCRAKCQPGLKFYCLDKTRECACVSKDHCDFDNECPDCPKQKRYCAKYDSTTGAMRKNRCFCLNLEQCQQNGDCPTLQCCISQSSTTATSYPYDRFGHCDTYRHEIGKGCPHGNVDGIEARNPKGKPAPVQNG